MTTAAQRIDRGTSVIVWPEYDRANDPTAGRHGRGRAILDAYARHAYGSPEDRADLDMVASDLIADLMHALTEAGGDELRESVIGRAERSYEGDVAEDEDEGAPCRKGGRK